MGIEQASFQTEQQDNSIDNINHLTLKTKLNITFLIFIRNFQLLECLLHVTTVCRG